MTRPDRAFLVCLTCGESLAQRMATKYCSKRCTDIARGMTRAEPLPNRVCLLAECGVTFTPKAERQNCCCEKHGALHCMRERRRTGKEPREPWGDARRERYQRRRALKKAAATGEVVVFSAVADRDGWVCGLCDVAVDPDLQWPDPFSGSLDHVVPLSRGGAHDPGNVQLAHLRCNTVKGNRIEVLA